MLLSRFSWSRVAQKRRTHCAIVLGAVDAACRRWPWWLSKPVGVSRADQSGSPGARKPGTRPLTGVSSARTPFVDQRKQRRCGHDLGHRFRSEIASTVCTANVIPGATVPKTAPVNDAVIDDDLGHHAENVPPPRPAGDGRI